VGWDGEQKLQTHKYKMDMYDRLGTSPVGARCTSASLQVLQFDPSRYEETPFDEYSIMSSSFPPPSEFEARKGLF
jgi:hypothetical protein